jgi:hypothetical protein
MGRVRSVNEGFVEMANPHSWLLAARNLHEQALFLYGQRGRSQLRCIDFRTNVSKTWDDVNKSVFLLGGFALENAIKSFLVYENPQWISNGKLSKHLRSHSLTSLQKQSSLIPYKKRYISVLQQFEEGLESWARYPCSLCVATSMDEEVMRHDVWSGYDRLMRAYVNRLETLLAHGWNGPHGFYGRWSFETSPQRPSTASRETGSY